MSRRSFCVCYITATKENAGLTSSRLVFFTSCVHVRAPKCQPPPLTHLKFSVVAQLIVLNDHLVAKSSSCNHVLSAIEFV